VMEGVANIVHILTVLTVHFCQQENLTPVGNVRFYGDKCT